MFFCGAIFCVSVKPGKVTQYANPNNNESQLKNQERLFSSFLHHIKNRPSFRSPIFYSSLKPIISSRRLSAIFFSPWHLLLHWWTIFRAAKQLHYHIGCSYTVHRLNTVQSFKHDNRLNTIFPLIIWCLFYQSVKLTDNAWLQRFWVLQNFFHLWNNDFSDNCKNDSSSWLTNWLI